MEYPTSIPLTQQTPWPPTPITIRTTSDNSNGQPCINYASTVHINLWYVRCVMLTIKNANGMCPSSIYQAVVAYGATSLQLWLSNICLVWDCLRCASHSICPLSVRFWDLFFSVFSTRHTADRFARPDTHTHSTRDTTPKITKTKTQTSIVYCLFELIKNLPTTLNVISQETLTDESRENNRNKYLMKFETNTLAVNFCE